jgi:hypothetical protein
MSARSANAYQRARSRALTPSHRRPAAEQRDALRTAAEQREHVRRVAAGLRPTRETRRA